jgi:hypothetical protein
VLEPTTYSFLSQRMLLLLYAEMLFSYSKGKASLSLEQTHFVINALLALDTYALFLRGIAPVVARGLLLCP